MNLKLICALTLLFAAGTAFAQEEETDAAPKKTTSTTKKKKKKKTPVVEEVEQPTKDSARRAAAKYRTDGNTKPAMPDDEAEFPAPTPGRAVRRATGTTAAAKPARPAARTAVPDEVETPAPAPREPDSTPAGVGRPGLMRVVVPASKRVRAVTVYLEESGERAVVEDQAAPTPNSIVNVGRGTASEIDFDRGNVKDERGTESLAAIFYVFSGVVKLKEMELTPAFLKKGMEIIDSGDTPAVFTLEVLALDRIGDTEGDVLKTFEDLSFKIGEVNPIPLNIEIPGGKKVGVRLSVPAEKVGGETLFLQFKAAKKGKFPVNVVASQGVGKQEKRVSYSPQVRFSFVPNAADMDTFANPTESLIGQINKYIERHGRGESEITVPLRVRVDYR